jgi:hypothetical protein
MISRLKKVSQRRDDMIIEERNKSVPAGKSGDAPMPVLTETGQNAQAAE